MAARKKSRPAKKSAKKSAKKTPRKSALRAAPQKVPPIPKGVHTITPRLCFEDTAFAIQFYEHAFGAKELYRLNEPDGKVGHAEIRIGDSLIMMSDEYPEMAVLSAKSRGGSPISLALTVKNADNFMARASAAGATVLRPVQDEFYGYRSGAVMDPFGYSWFIMHQVSKVSPKQMQKRLDKLRVASKPEGSVA